MPFDLVILLLGIYPIDIFTHKSNDKLHIRMSAEAPLATTRNFKHSK